MAKIVWENRKKSVRVKARHDGEGVLLCPQCPKGAAEAENLHITQARRGLGG